MGWIPYSSTYCQTHVGSCGYVPLCQAPKATASQDPNSSGAYLVLEALECGCREPWRVLSRTMWLGRNRCPLIPWVQHPDSSPHAFRLAGGQSRSLDER
jgi:hypothetical protein